MQWDWDPADQTGPNTNVVQNILTQFLASLLKKWESGNPAEAGTVGAALKQESTTMLVALCSALG